MNILRQMTLKERIYQGLSIMCFVIGVLLNVILMVVILDMFSSIMNSNVVTNLPYFWLRLIVVLVVKGGFNTCADLFKHYAGFEITGRIREKITLRLKKFSLGFYSKERLNRVPL